MASKQVILYFKFDLKRMDLEGPAFTSYVDQKTAEMRGIMLKMYKAYHAGEDMLDQTFKDDYTPPSGDEPEIDWDKFGL